MKIAVEMTIPQREFIGWCDNVEGYARGCEPGVEVIGFTTGKFSLIDVIRCVVGRIGGGGIVISTWTAAQAEMDHVDEFIADGVVRSAKWIVDRSFQNRQPILCDSLRRAFGDDAIRVQRVHCKFVLVESDAAKVTIQTSANLNKNSRIENISVSSCPVLFDAYSGLVSEIFETQMPGAGFESSPAVTRSFNTMKKKATRRLVSSPWLQP